MRFKSVYVYVHAFPFKEQILGISSFSALSFLLWQITTVRQKKILAEMSAKYGYLSLEYHKQKSENRQIK